MSRTATIKRETGETEVQVALELDGTGNSACETGIGFLDHMLDQLARHGLFNLTVRAVGDTHVDDHHTVEDVGIAVGRAFREALGDRQGLQRFGSAYAPLDESLSRVVVDLSNRPHLAWRVVFPGDRIGAFDSELLKEWFAAFAGNARVTLHVETLYGENGHHIAESCFKALALALRAACAEDPCCDGTVPSTKGTLSD